MKGEAIFFQSKFPINRGWPEREKCKKSRTCKLRCAIWGSIMFDLAHRGQIELPVRHRRRTHFLFMRQQQRPCKIITFWRYHSRASNQINVAWKIRRVGALDKINSILIANFTSAEPICLFDDLFPLAGKIWAHGGGIFSALPVYPSVKSNLGEMIYFPSGCSAISLLDGKHG